MTDSSIKLSEAEINKIHERVLRTAQARDRSADVDMDVETLSRIASNAYFLASRGGESLAQAEQRALVALNDASPEATRMRRYAAWELELFEDSESEQRRGFLSDFVLALLPVLIVVTTVWVAMSYGSSAAEKLWAVVLPLSGVAAAAAAAFIFFNKRGDTSAFDRGALHHGMLAVSLSLPFRQSGGTIAAGFIALVLTGFLGHAELERREVREFDANLQKLNQALAVALAGAQAGASLSETQSALRKVTDVSWIQLQDSPDNSGTWVASADSPARRMSALVRVSRTSAELADLQVLKFVAPDAGEQENAPEYVVGKVVKTDLDKVTLLIGNSERRIVLLPDNTLAPAENSEVMAVLPKDSGKAMFLQPIDGLVDKLAH